MSDRSVTGGGESPEQRRPPASRSKGGTPQNPAPEPSSSRGHPGARLLPAHSGGPCCGRTSPCASADTAPVYTCATDRARLHASCPPGAGFTVASPTVGICLSRVSEGPTLRDPDMDAPSIKAPRGLICPCWTDEVGPAGMAASPTLPLCLPLPIRQLSPSRLLHTCFCPLFSSLAKSPRLLWSLTSYFN